MLLKKAKGFIKLKSFIKHLNSNGGQIGSRIRGMIINYDNRCNFQCQHCFTRSAAKDSCSRKINIQDVKRVCDELDVLGGWELDIQGGEPLIFPDLATLICFWLRLVLESISQVESMLTLILWRLLSLWLLLVMWHTQRIIS